MQRSDYASACKLHSCTLVLHQMSRLIPSLILCLALAAQPSHGDSLPERPRAVLNQQLVPDTAVTRRRAGRHERRKSRRSQCHRPRQPASTMKLVPTWAALELLGPAYTWKTRAWSDAPVVKGVLKGNLYLQGGGDPLLTIERWWRFVAICARRDCGSSTATSSSTRPGSPHSTSAPRTSTASSGGPTTCCPTRCSSTGSRRISSCGRRMMATASTSRSSHIPDGLVVENRVVLTDRPLRRPQSPHRDHESRPTSPERVIVTGQISRELRAADVAPRDHGTGAVRLRHVRHAVAPAGRRVHGRHAARADAADGPAAADPGVAAAGGDRARHQQVLEQHDGALAGAHDRRRDERNAGDHGGWRGVDPGLARQPRARLPGTRHRQWLGSVARGAHFRATAWRGS